MNTRQNGFLIANVVQVANLAQNIVGGAATTFATRNGGDAKGTGIVATILHFDERPCTPSDLFLIPFVRLKVVGFGGDSRQLLHEGIFVLVANDTHYPVQLGEVLGSELGMATRNRNGGIGLGAVCLGDHLAPTFYRVVGHGTGVDDNLVSKGAIVNDGVSLLLQLPRHCVNLALVEATTEHF
jgi:hypothetical protein